MNVTTSQGTSSKGKADTRQAQRSAKTREAIMEAAIDCYATLGYTKTTTSTIVASAGVSRGAIAHHFESLADVVENTAEHIKIKRLADLRRRYEKFDTLLTREARIESMRIYWKWIRTKDALAYYELLSESRTNKDLRRVIGPISKQFQKAFHQTVWELFPEMTTEPGLEAISEVVVKNFFEGMALNNDGKGKKKREEVEQAIIFMADIIGKLWDDAL